VSHAEVVSVLFVIGLPVGNDLLSGDFDDEVSPDLFFIPFYPALIFGLEYRVDSGV
jgi:hypothetical protein